MTTLENNRTLVDNYNPDESLIGGDFEVIERHVEVSENESPAHSQEPNQSVGQWSIQQSITLDGTMTINMSAPEVPEEASEAEKNLDNETPVLDGSVIRTIPEILRSQCENTLESWGSNETLNSMLASQAETKELLTASIAKIEKLTEELAELEGVKKVVEELKVELQEKTQRIHVLEQSNLVKQESQQQNSLQEELYNRGRELDEKETSLNTVRAELEAANRKIADIESSRKYLNEQLDSMCAKYLNEKELRAIVEEQLNAVQQGRTIGGRHHKLRRQQSGVSSPSTPLFDDRGAAEQVRLLTEQNEKFQKQVGKDQPRRECFQIKSLDEEIRNRDEIISVLREDHVEGNRLIAEKEYQITELERMVESIDQRLQMESS